MSFEISLYPHQGTEISLPSFLSRPQLRTFFVDMHNVASFDQTYESFRISI
jgi:hypothetical protein